jgi:hypothetical protein
VVLVECCDALGAAGLVEPADGTEEAGWLRARACYLGEGEEAVRCHQRSRMHWKAQGLAASAAWKPEGCHGSSRSGPSRKKEEPSRWVRPADRLRHLQADPLEGFGLTEVASGVCDHSEIDQRHVRATGQSRARQSSSTSSSTALTWPPFRIGARPHARPHRVRSRACWSMLHIAPKIICCDSLPGRAHVAARTATQLALALRTWADACRLADSTTLARLRLIHPAYASRVCKT